MWYKSCVFILAISFLLKASFSVYVIPKSSPKQLTSFLTNISFPRLNYIEPGGITYYKSPDNNETYLYHAFSLDADDANPPPYGSHIYAKSDIFDLDLNPIDDIDLPYTLDVDTEDQLYGDNLCTNPVTNDILNCWFTKSHNWGAAIICNIFFVKTATFSPARFLGWMSYGKSFGVLCFNDGYLIPFGVSHPSSSEPSSINAAILDLDGHVVSNEIIKVPGTTLDVTTYSSIQGSNFDATLINASASGLFVINAAVGVDPAIIESLYGFFTNGKIHIYKDEKVNVYDYNLFLSDVIDFTEDCCYISLYRKGWSDSFNVYGLITDIYGNRINNNTDQLLIEDLSSLAGLSYARFVDLPMLSMSDSNGSNNSIQSHYFGILYYKEDDADAQHISMNVYYLSKNNTKYALTLVHTFKTAAGVNYKSEGKVYMWGLNVYNLPGSSDIHIIWQQEIEVHVNNTYIHYPDIYGQTFEVSFTNAPSAAPSAAPSSTPTAATETPTTSPIILNSGSDTRSQSAVVTVVVIVCVLVVLSIGIGAFIFYRRKKTIMEDAFVNLNQNEVSIN